MTDPLSIVASITSLLAVGTQVTKEPYQFIDSARSASGDIRDLARELRELCSILGDLERNFGNDVRHKELWLNLEDVLGSCMRRFQQLQALVNTHMIKAGDGFCGNRNGRSGLSRRRGLLP